MKHLRHAWVTVVWAVVGSFMISSASVTAVMAAETGAKAADTSGKAADTSGKAADTSGKAATAKAKPKTVTGMVEKTDKGIILKARREIYTVTGKDLSSLVGKKVKVTGTLTKTEKGSTFHVMRAQEIKPTKPLPVRR
jgi:hypothetical protein